MRELNSGDVPWEMPSGGKSKFKNSCGFFFKQKKIEIVAYTCFVCFCFFLFLTLVQLSPGDFFFLLFTADEISDGLEWMSSVARIASDGI